MIRIITLSLLIGFVTNVTWGSDPKETNTSSSDISKISFYTEEYPPFNFSENGKDKGILVDFLLDVLKNSNATISREDIKIVPWAFGYRHTEKQKNVCLFGMARTANRENLFKWVGPIM